MAIKFDTLSFLIIEDNKLLIELIVSVLEGIGAKSISVAMNGEQGYEVFNNEYNDIIIADWDMEPMDGITFTKKIRTDASCVNNVVPIILLTGYAEKARIATARDAGVTEYVIKPFTAETLIKRITHVINFPRDFIEAPEFIGPDRRRRQDPKFTGPFRREGDDK